jgi:hypothetical protein
MLTGRNLSGVSQGGPVTPASGIVVALRMTETLRAATGSAAQRVN